MYPLKTYIDIADVTYSKGSPLEIRRKWGRLVVRDSNTAGNDYLRIDAECADSVPYESVETCGRVSSGSIRINRKQAKMVVKAIQKFIDESEEAK